MQNKTILMSIAAGLLLILAALSVFVVYETQLGIVVRLGRLVIDPATKEAKVLAPGIHVKVPIIDTVHLFDRRIQNLDIQSSRIPTKEKKELMVDLFAKWRIEDFSKYYKATNGENRRTEQLLREKIIDGLRGEFGRRMLTDVVSQDRMNVMEKIRLDANKTAKGLGVEVVDARIVGIELPREVREAVFNLMRTERQQVASEHRAQGRSRAEAIRANADAKVTIIKATADREAHETRGEGDGKAAGIYADAYGRDPEFYSFYRSLEAYRETFKGNNDMLVVKPDDAFFKYFRRSGNAKSANSEKS